ncbi:hypothetical protein [Alteromonas sp. a30]|uniref:hypothetical protein n=1 Tax=Alteromonas sp. a30 TaxID=2730917 RepID=UPI002282D15A|nr:hypothetical protein [Alteromonas sp. a30]MCY7295076.1 hypothetical protein [Alteromonas sp. a30]
MQANLSNLMKENGVVNIWSLFSQIPPVVTPEEWARITNQDERKVTGQVAHRTVPVVSFAEGKGTKKYISVVSIVVKALEQNGYTVTGVEKA